MPVNPDGAIVRLRGVSGPEEAEVLQAWLLANPGGTVDLAACEHLHTAVLQVLMAARCPITGTVADPMLHQCLAAALDGTAPDHDDKRELS